MPAQRQLWPGRLLLLLGLCLAAPASAVSSATQPRPPHPPLGPVPGAPPTLSPAEVASLQHALDSALRGLRDDIEASIEKNYHEIRESANISFAAEMSEAVKAQRSALDGMASDRERELEKVRQALARAKAAVATPARDAAKEGGKVVEEAAVAQLGRLDQAAGALLQQARDLGVHLDVPEANISRLTARMRAARARSRVDAASLEAALARAESEKPVASMNGNVELAMKAADSMDTVAAATLSVLDEAERRATHASEVALQAVNRATQNALKLKTIREMVLDTARISTDAARRAAAKTAA